MTRPKSGPRAVSSSGQTASPASRFTTTVMECAMPEFCPFRVFQEKLFESAKAPTRDVAGPASDVLDYLRNRYANIEVSNSFVDAAGQHIDCVRISQQPSLRSGDSIAGPPEFVEMPGTMGQRLGSAPAAPLAEDRRDQFGNPAYCPPGFVPIARVTPDQIHRAGGLRRFFQKAPGGGRHPSFGSSRRKVIARTVSPAGGPAKP